MTTGVFRSLFIAVAASAALLPSLASAMPITKTLDVSVYQLCDDAGLNCASKGPVGNEYFLDSTNKIWEQAGISVTFSFISQINSSQFLDLDGTPGDDFWDLHSAYGTLGPSASSVDMFLINSFAGAYGVGWYGAGGLIMSMQTIMNFNCGGAPGCTGRLDTLAHELGHNFGLVDPADPDYNFGLNDGHSSNPDHLMASGLYRNVPTTLADINPDGFGLDRLTQYQIDKARQSSLLRDVVVSTNNVPEPASLALLGMGLLAFGVSRRRAA